MINTKLFFITLFLITSIKLSDLPEELHFLVDLSADVPDFINTISESLAQTPSTEEELSGRISSLYSLEIPHLLTTFKSIDDLKRAVAAKVDSFESKILQKDYKEFLTELELIFKKAAKDFALNEVEGNATIEINLPIFEKIVTELFTKQETISQNDNTKLLALLEKLIEEMKPKYFKFETEFQIYARLVNNYLEEERNVLKSLLTRNLDALEPARVESDLKNSVALYLDSFTRYSEKQKAPTAGTILRDNILAGTEGKKNPRFFSRFLTESLKDGLYPRVKNAAKMGLFQTLQHAFVEFNPKVMSNRVLCQAARSLFGFRKENFIYNDIIDKNLIFDSIICILKEWGRNDLVFEKPDDIFIKLIALGDKFVYEMKEASLYNPDNYPQVLFNPNLEKITDVDYRNLLNKYLGALYAAHLGFRREWETVTGNKLYVRDFNKYIDKNYKSYGNNYFLIKIFAVFQTGIPDDLELKFIDVNDEMIKEAAVLFDLNHKLLADEDKRFSFNQFVQNITGENMKSTEELLKKLSIIVKKGSEIKVEKKMI